MEVRETLVYQCGNCQKYYNEKGAAENCCTRHLCPRCGAVEISRYFNLCDTCRLENAFEKAQKTEAENWKGWVFWEDFGYNDGYFEDVGELLEYCDNESVDIPPWVFSCKQEQVEVNIDNVIEGLQKELPENAEIPEPAIEELWQFLENWNKKNGVPVYWPDYSTVIVLKKEEK